MTVAVRSSLIALLALALVSSPAAAATPEELRAKIDEQNKQIQELEKEIDQYQGQLEVIGTEKQSLQSAIKTLDVSRKKISADVSVTTKKISATDLELQELAFGIGDTKQKITRNTKAVAETLRRLNEIESDTLVETVLAHDDLSELWNQIESIQRFQTVVRDRVAELGTLKENLEDKQDVSIKKRRELVAYKAQLGDQQRILDNNRKEKNVLLSTTKNKESNYQKILNDTIARRDALAQELLDYESQLKIAIDPSALPSVGSGVLAWPVDSVKITQFFGKTSFSTQNPQVYNGNGHNGVDLRASVGTPIKAALSGTVEGVGDTDAVCPRASYGKWVLIKHANGLSTLYAHLSLIRVSPGQSVGTREIIGYGGNTGYSTGPHLHFTVYATQGVRVTALKSRVCRGTYTIPVADLKAYLNPLSYL